MKARRIYEDGPYTWILLEVCPERRTAESSIECEGWEMLRGFTEKVRIEVVFIHIARTGTQNRSLKKK